MSEAAILYVCSYWYVFKNTQQAVVSGKKIYMYQKKRIHIDGYGRIYIYSSWLKYCEKKDTEHEG